MRNAITPSEQLAVTLRFLATGETYTSLQYRLRIIKGTSSLIIPKVCKALSFVLCDVISCPNTADEWLEMSDCFQCRWQLPNCLGAIDGKHVRVRHPPESGLDYFNYCIKVPLALCLWKLWIQIQSSVLLMLVVKVSSAMEVFCETQSSTKPCNLTCSRSLNLTTSKCLSR